MFSSKHYQLALSDACKLCDNLNIKSISIPAIGLGLANGDIEEILWINDQCSRIIDINWYILDKELFDKIIKIKKEELF